MPNAAATLSSDLSRLSTTHTPSVLPYFGGKSPSKGIGRWISERTPMNARYVEPFAGMLGVLRARPKAEVEIVNDLDGRIVTWWEVLRTRTDELRHELTYTPWSRTVYKECQSIVRSVEPVDDLVMARAVAVVLLQSTFSGLPGTGWRAGERWVTADSIIEGLDALADRLRAVRLECRDALDVLADWAGKADTTIYVDPPYGGIDEYAHNTNFEQLAEIVGDAQADVAISGYLTCGWDDLLPGWERAEFATQAQFASGERTECLWMNYQPPQATLL